MAALPCPAELIDQVTKAHMNLELEQCSDFRKNQIWMFDHLSSEAD